MREPPSGGVRSTAAPLVSSVQPSGATNGLPSTVVRGVSAARVSGSAGAGALAAGACVVAVESEAGLQPPSSSASAPNATRGRRVMIGSLVRLGEGKTCGLPLRTFLADGATVGWHGGQGSGSTSLHAGEAKRFPDAGDEG